MGKKMALGKRYIKGGGEVGGRGGGRGGGGGAMDGEGGGRCGLGGGRGGMVGGMDGKVGGRGGKGDGTIIRFRQANYAFAIKTPAIHYPFSSRPPISGE